MILVSGSAGKTGLAVIGALARRGAAVRGLVKTEAQAAPVIGAGAGSIVTGDMEEFSTWQRALKGVRALYLISPNMHPRETVIGRLALYAARRAGVAHVVYHSVLHPQTEAMSHHWQKLRVEEMLFESRIPFTIFQPAPYMQNFLAGWKHIIEDGVLRVPYSVHANFSFVHLEDIAEAAKVVLTQAGHKNAIYELAGTLPTSHMDVAEVFCRVLGRDVHAEKEEIGDWKARAQQGRISKYALENLINMFTYYDQWGLVGNSNVLRWLLKREPMSLESFIVRIANENNAAN